MSASAYTWPNPADDGNPLDRFAPTSDITPPPTPQCSAPTGTSWGTLGPPNEMVLVPPDMRVTTEADNKKMQVILQYASQMKCTPDASGTYSSSCGYPRAFVKLHEWFWTRQVGPAFVPINLSVPTISGSPVLGNALSTSDGTWGGSPSSYARQWQDCDNLGSNCGDIAGATGSTYFVRSSDIGHTVRATVWATNGAGPSTRATSSATAVVTDSGTGTATLGMTTPGSSSDSGGGGYIASVGPVRGQRDDHPREPLRLHHRRQRELTPARGRLRRQQQPTRNAGRGQQRGHRRRPSKRELGHVPAPRPSDHQCGRLLDRLLVRRRQQHTQLHQRDRQRPLGRDPVLQHRQPTHRRAPQHLQRRLLPQRHLHDEQHFHVGGDHAGELVGFRRGRIHRAVGPVRGQRDDHPREPLRLHHRRQRELTPARGRLRRQQQPTRNAGRGQQRGHRRRPSKRELGHVPAPRPSDHQCGRLLDRLLVRRRQQHTQLHQRATGSGRWAATRTPAPPTHPPACTSTPPTATTPSTPPTTSSQRPVHEWVDAAATMRDVWNRLVQIVEIAPRGRQSLTEVCARKNRAMRGSPRLSARSST